MTTTDFIIELFCRIDDAMPTAKKHTQANLRPSEVVTLAILFALKVLAIGLSIVGSRATTKSGFQSYQSAPGSSDCSTATAIGPKFSWQTIL